MGLGRPRAVERVQVTPGGLLDVGADGVATADGVSGAGSFPWVLPWLFLERSCGFWGRWSHGGGGVLEQG